MSETKAAETWPKIYHNVNVPAQIIHNADELARAGAGWVELDLAAQGLALAPAPVPPKPPRGQQ